MFSRKIGVLALCAAVFAANEARAAYSGEVFDVSTVDELTNACKLANSNNNVIRLAPGVYDVSKIKMSAVSHIEVLSGGVGRMMIGMGSRPEDVVLKGAGMDSGSGLRVLEANSYTISNLTVTGGCCSQAGGGIQDGYVVDCIISNNFCNGAGGGVDKANLRLCRFYGNKCSNGNGGGARCSQKTCYDCVFSNNCSTANGGGLSLGTAYNVEFYCNTAGSSGGAAHSCTINGGTFVGNRVYGTSQAAVNGCTVNGGYFYDNISTNATTGSSAGEIATGTFTDCVFDAHKVKDVAFSGVTFNRCELNDIGISGVHRSVFRNCTARNSRFLRTSVNYGSGSNGMFADGSKFYNCTIVDTVNKNLTAQLSSSCLAVNTIIVGCSPRDMGSGTGVPIMTNCIWGVQSGEPAEERAIGCKCLNGRDIRFSDPTNGDYTLKRGSLARNAGWSDDDYLAAVGPVDLNGNPRIYEGDGPEKAIIDIGCYECQIPAPGLMLLVR